MENGQFMTPYDHRVKLVQDTMMKNSTLGEKASHELAVQVLHVLDHIPAKVR